MSASHSPRAGLLAALVLFTPAAACTAHTTSSAPLVVAVPPPARPLEPPLDQRLRDMLSLVEALEGAWRCEGSVNVAPIRSLRPPLSPEQLTRAPVSFTLQVNALGKRLLNRPGVTAQPRPAWDTREKLPVGPYTRSPFKLVTLETRFTRPPPRPEDYGDALHGWWMFDARSKRLDTQSCELGRFSFLSGRWRSRSVTWRIFVSTLGETVERLELGADGTLKLTATIVVDGQGSFTDHEATCRR